MSDRTLSERRIAITRLLAAVFLMSGGWTIVQTLGSLVSDSGSTSSGVRALAAQEVAEPETGDAQAGAGRGLRAYSFDVPLPISDAVKKSVARRIERTIRQAFPEGRALAAGQRPVFIFEFRPASGTAGEGSSFDDAVGLARIISGDRLSGIRTVAWVPRTVKGHAVLAVLACEEIIIARDAELGAAGLNETVPIENTIRSAYLEYPSRHRTVPPAIALGLLDKDLAVYKVETTAGKGVRFETGEELQKLRAAGLSGREETVFQPGDHHLLSGAKMREYGFATHLADSRRALAEALQVPLAAIEQHLAPEDGWRPLRIDLNGPVHKQAVNWILKSLDDHLDRREFNLLVLHLDTGGGDLNESTRLAQRLATLGDGILTVAYVNRKARSDAALIALACDELVMHPDGHLGGRGEGKNLADSDLAVVRPALEEIYAAKHRDWSLPLALVDPDIRVYRYRNPLAGEVRYLSDEEASTIAAIDQWQRDDRPLDTEAGLEVAQAEELGLVRMRASTAQELRDHYQIEGELPPLRPNWALAFIEWLADPRIAGVLLFVGGFALLFELSTPGLGVPGFTAVVCFILFFWSQFLHGTAGWLEVLLFVGGLACLAVELFALPGFGVFGFGGGLMIIASIVLASQTYVLPTNAYQLRQFPISLLMMAAGMAGGIASIIVIRQLLPDTPYFNRMLLAPPRPEEREELSRREALVTFDHLRNKRGTTTTPLVPAGKVLFGDELVDCISSGELIPKGTDVVVEEVAGNRVVVRKVDR